jgi:hypothetical protein
LDRERGDKAGSCDPCRVQRRRETLTQNWKRKAARISERRAERRATEGQPFRLSDISPEERERHLRERRIREHVARHGREPIPAGYRDFQRYAAKLLAKMDRRIEQIAEAKAYREQRPWLQTDDPAEKFRLRYRLDPEFNLRERIRAAGRKEKLGYRIASRVRDSVSAKRPRSPSLEATIGYPMAALKTHIERQFGRGMTWERFLGGEIVIDHIVPLASFDLSSETEVRAAWALSNLRPLWAKDNAEKAAKRLFLL